MSKLVARDLSWLSFNKRVLQEATDETNPLQQRIKFLGIFANNLDEFFSVRYATLQKITEISYNQKNKAVNYNQQILKKTNTEAAKLFKESSTVFANLVAELQKQHVHFITEKQLQPVQKKFIQQFFTEKIQPNIVPLVLNEQQEFPILNQKSLYLACVLSKKNNSLPEKFALISVPLKKLNRFVLLPNDHRNEQQIILLEDIIRYHFKKIFSFFGYDSFKSHIIKINRDAELYLDADLPGSILKKIEKGLKKRKEGKPINLIFDAELSPKFLYLLTKKLNLKATNLIPSKRIVHYSSFLQFPSILNKVHSVFKKPLTHPLLVNEKSIQALVLQKDVLLSFPYQSFNAVIDLLREAAIDPSVTSIHITCYRLAETSSIANALINASRNGKKVKVILELKARFDEEANMHWKEKFEENNVEVHVGIQNKKVHAKLCVIKKQADKRITYYGFVSTGNLNEETAKLYTDYCLLTSNKQIMADAMKIFSFLTSPKKEITKLKSCKTLWVSPVSMRSNFIKSIQNEIKNCKEGLPASIIIKANALADEVVINKLMQAAKIGVKISLIIRSACSLPLHSKILVQNVFAISIVDHFLEHARVYYFYNNNKPQVFISSADLMVRNLDYRIETACPIYNDTIKQQITEMLHIQLSDNVKARYLHTKKLNQIVQHAGNTKNRSQLTIQEMLAKT
jgi:polyphosphate kinase